MYSTIVLAVLTITFVNGSAEVKDSTESNVEEVSKVEGEGRSFYNRHNRPYYGNVVYDRPYSYDAAYQNPYGYPQQYGQLPQQYGQLPQQYGQLPQQNYVNVGLDTGAGRGYDSNYGSVPGYTNNAGGAVNNINVDVDLNKKPGFLGQNYPVIPGRIPPIRPYNLGYPRLYRSKFSPVKRSLRQSRFGLNNIITDVRSGNKASYIQNNLDLSPDANYRTQTDKRDAINQVRTDEFRTAPPLAKRAQQVEGNNINPGFNNEQISNPNPSGYNSPQMTNPNPSGYNNPRMTNPNPSGLHNARLPDRKTGFNNAQMSDRNTRYNNPQMTNTNPSGLHNARLPDRNPSFKNVQIPNQNHGLNNAQIPNQNHGLNNAQMLKYLQMSNQNPGFNNARMPDRNPGLNNARMPDRNPGLNNAWMPDRNPGFNNVRMPDRNFAHKTANNRILKPEVFDETDFGLTENGVNDQINKEMSSQLEDLAVEDDSEDYQ